MVPYAPHSLEADGPSQLVLVIVKIRESVMFSIHPAVIEVEPEYSCLIV